MGQDSLGARQELARRLARGSLGGSGRRSGALGAPEDLTLGAEPPTGIQSSAVAASIRAYNKCRLPAWVRYPISVRPGPPLGLRKAHASRHVSR